MAFQQTMNILSILSKMTHQERQELQERMEFIYDHNEDLDKSEYVYKDKTGTIKTMKTNDIKDILHEIGMPKEIIEKDEGVSKIISKMHDVLFRDDSDSDSDNEEKSKYDKNRQEWECFKTLHMHPINSTIQEKDTFTIHNKQGKLEERHIDGTLGQYVKMFQDIGLDIDKQILLSKGVFQEKMDNLYKEGITKKWSKNKFAKKAHKLRDIELELVQQMFNDAQLV
jgi:hypothetical protein